MCVISQILISNDALLLWGNTAFTHTISSNTLKSKFLRSDQQTGITNGLFSNFNLTQLDASFLFSIIKNQFPRPIAILNESHKALNLIYNIEEPTSLVKRTASVRNSKKKERNEDKKQTN